MADTWIYHRTEPGKIVDSSECEEYYSKGWKDTPAAFQLPESKDELWVALEKHGVIFVRKELEFGLHNKDKKSLIEAWLEYRKRETDNDRQDKKDQREIRSIEISNSAKNAAWVAVAISIVAIIFSLYAISKTS